MARFTAQSRLFNGDSITTGGGLRLLDVSPIARHLHKRKLMSLSGSPCTRILASNTKSSSPSKSSSGNYNLKYKQLKREEETSSVGSDEIYGEDEEDDEDDLSCFRGLVLDIAYRPVNVVCWKRAICLEYMDKADVLEYYDQTLDSPSGSFYIPAVLRVPHLLQVVKRRRIKSTLSRKNILSRDNFTCQYCSSSERLTVDHVLPISRGGEWTWENLVTACLSCNSRKGHKTLEEANMNLSKTPKAPKDYYILAIPLTSHAIRILKIKKETSEEWQQYLSKPSP